MVFDQNEKKKKKNSSRALLIIYKQFFKTLNIFFISTLLSFALEFTMPQVYRSYINTRNTYKKWNWQNYCRNFYFLEELYIKTDFEYY